MHVQSWSVNKNSHCSPWSPWKRAAKTQGLRLHLTWSKIWRLIWWFTVKQSKHNFEGYNKNSDKRSLNTIEISQVSSIHPIRKPPRKHSQAVGISVLHKNWMLHLESGAGVEPLRAEKACTCEMATYGIHDSLMSMYFSYMHVTEISLPWWWSWTLENENNSNLY